MTEVRALALLLTLALATSACGRVIELEPPELDDIARVPPEQSLVLDADGNQLAVLRLEFRERVDLEELPDHLVAAVVAAEDQRFFSHAGLDARAIARAATANLAAGEIAQGGSTITQQLVKNLYMPEAPRTPATKVREALLARQMEQTRSKPEILGEYLNTVYFGNGAYGVQAAAETYWRKDARDLTLAESALLAGIIRAPGTLNPERTPEEARRRRDDVLAAMREQATAAPDAIARAQAEPVRVAPRPPSPETREPYWVDFVLRTLLTDPTFGADERERAQRLYAGGLRIHTTLVPRLQSAAREAIASFLPAADDPEAALVHIDPATGHVLAAIGGRDHARRQFDLATQGHRQPGSTFKTFVLAAAVSSGLGPDHRVDGDPAVLDTRNGPWRVRNYDGRSPGYLRLEDATAASVNGAFARLILDVGVGRVAALAHAMGVRSPINEDPPIALGGLQRGVTPLDMASAYATLANLGRHVPATPVSRIEDAEGAVVWRPDRRERRALDPSAAFVTTQMLRGVVEAGTGTAARIRDWEVAGKTGTTDDHADAWFVGYTPTMAASVWMGHPDARVPLRSVRGIRRVTGGTIPARIWQAYAQRALDGIDPVDFHLPAEHYEMVRLDPASGLRTAPWCAGEPTPVPRAIVPRGTCPSPPPQAEVITPTPAPSCPPEGGGPSPSPSSSPVPAPESRPEACTVPHDVPAPAPNGPAPGPSTAAPSPRG